METVKPKLGLSAVSCHLEVGIDIKTANITTMWNVFIDLKQWSLEMTSNNTAGDEVTEKPFK